ncbi:MAG: dihydroorotase family protein [Candidatus Binatia bacterium]
MVYIRPRAGHGGSGAAALGGVTTVLNMPSTQPIVSTPEILVDKKRILEQKSLIDFGPRAAVTPDNLDWLEELAEAGAIAFKVFMGQSVRSPWLHDGYLVEAFGRIGQIGLGVGVHAENHYLIEHIRTDLQDISAETCPQYLLLSRKDYDRLGSMIKINPPVRDWEDMEALYEGLLDGTIDMIATDHSPLPLEEKVKENIWEATAGFCGVETLLPLMLTELKRGRFSVADLVRLTSENPARANSVYPTKGSIKVGSDADLVIVDLDREGVILADKLHSKTKATPFEWQDPHQWPRPQARVSP